MNILAFEKQNKKKHARSKMLLVLMLVAVFCVAFALDGKAAFAYEVSGQYSINNNMTNVDEMPSGLAATTFHLYKVGHFEGEDPVFVLDDAYADLPVKIPLDYNRDDFDNEDDWTRAWLESANTLSNYVKEETLIQTFQSAPDGSFSISGIENGLYLLKGDSQVIRDYPTAGQSSYWWPQPMYVRILNGDAQIGVKPQTECITKLQVIKTWQGDETVKNTIRPESVDVEIYYDGVLRETVTLGPESNWMYEWETAQGENDPSKWSCKEILSKKDAANYRVSISESYFGSAAAKAGDTKRMTLTNTYIGKTPNEGSAAKTKTGDNSPLMKSLIALLIALAAGLVIVLSRKRR